MHQVYCIFASIIVSYLLVTRRQLLCTANDLVKRFLREYMGTLSSLITV